MIVHVYKGHKKASVVSIPRDTLVDRPECTDTEGQDARRRVRRDVQLRVLHRRRRLRGEDRRVHHRDPHGPLPGGRLPRLREARRRARRRRDHHDQGHQGLRQPPGPEGRHAHAHRRAGPRPGPHPARRRRRLRPRAASSSSRRSSRPWSTRSRTSASSRSPKKLYDLADTATKAVTTDSDLGSVNSLVSFASGLKGISSANMTMVTMPVRYDPANPNRVLVRQGQGPAGLDGPEGRPADPEVGHEGHGDGRRRGRRDRRHLSSAGNGATGPVWTRRSTGVPGIHEPTPRFWGMAPVLADWYVGSGSRSASRGSDPAPSRN